MKRTKIVATIGPASESRAKLEQMVRLGLNVARLNFSHGSYENHTLLISNIRAASKKVGQPVAILQDLQGPRIRIGEVGNGVAIKAGEEIVLVPEDNKAKFTVPTIPVQYPNLAKDLKAGVAILIEDGTVELKVKKINGKAVFCTVVSGELIKTHKGMNFPSSSISAPPMTDKDKKDLAFGLSQDVDLVALSFVKNAQDVLNLRALMKRLQKNKSLPLPLIIAKIERPEAVKNLDSILAAADGIMVARGDLGLEIKIQELPLVQKHIIQRCKETAKPVIVATQMLDSMIRNPIPTRAEVSDVANAILDGADAIMLSGESASGKYPVEAVRLMAEIAASVETTAIKEHERLEESLKINDDIPAAIGFAAQDVAEDVGAAAIVCLTNSGLTARAVSRFRPKVQIIALASNERVRNQLMLSWGVWPTTLGLAKTIPDLVKAVRKTILLHKVLKAGDRIVIVASHPLGFNQSTNVLVVETL